MKTERILSLDLSTKTGWAIYASSDDNSYLVDCGQIPKIDCPEDEQYPASYVTWAYECYEAVEDMIEKAQPDVLVIEEVTKSKNAMSQKILDYIHFLVAKFVQETGIKSIYLQTGEWRKEVTSYMSPEEKKRNKEIKEYKKKNNVKLARDKNNKVIGQVTKKHVSVRRANELFGLSLKVGENDTADALLLAYAYHLKRLRTEK